MMRYDRVEGGVRRRALDSQCGLLQLPPLWPLPCPRKSPSIHRLADELDFQINPLLAALSPPWELVHRIDLMRPPDAMLLRRTWEGVPIAALLENHLPASLFCVWALKTTAQAPKVRRLE